MSTWTCKTALIAGVFLTGCSDLQDVFALNGAGANKSLPPTQVSLGKGMVRLVAPDGFCIDEGSVRERFALMARCDALGGQNLSADAPLAVITASLADIEAQTLPEHSTLAAENENVLQQSDAGNMRLVSVSGKPPASGLSENFWRGAGFVGPYVLGLAIYTPEDTLDLGDQAPALLEQAYDRTQTQSVAQAITFSNPEAALPQNGADKNKRRGGLFAGLFQ